MVGWKGERSEPWSLVWLTGDSCQDLDPVWPQAPAADTTSSLLLPTHQQLHTEITHNVVIGDWDYIFSTLNFTTLLQTHPLKKKIVKPQKYWDHERFRFKKSLSSIINFVLIQTFCCCREDSEAKENWESPQMCFPIITCHRTVS